MTSLPFLEQFAATYRWPSLPAKRLFRHAKEPNTGMKEDHRLALTLSGVIDRSLDDIEGLQSSDYSTYQIFEADDLVFKLIDLENIRTSRVGYVPRRGIMSPAYIRLVKHSGDALSKFYYWFFYAAYINNVFNGMGGGVRQNLTPTDLLQFPVPLPDRETQRAVADFLDRETARIDRLVERKFGLIKIQKELRASACLETLHDGLLGFEWDTHEQRYTFEFSSDEWRVKRVKHLVSFMTSGSRGWGDLIRDDGEVFLQSGNIGRKMDVDFDNVERVEPQTGAEAKRTRVRSGDSLVCITGGRTGAVGFVEPLPETSYINQHVCLLRPDPTKIAPRLLSQLLWSEIGQAQFTSAQYGLKQGLGFAEVANVWLPIPPQDLQPQIVAEIDRRTIRIDALTDQIQTSIDVLLERRSALITAAVTGQIDVSEHTRKGDTDRRLDAIEAEMRA